MSVKYLPDRRLPDKAIDLLTKACSGVDVRLRWPSNIDGEEDPSIPGVVTSREVIKEISKRTGIPITELSNDERDRLQDMAKELKRRVLGQDEACDAVAQTVQRGRLGLTSEGRPIGVLLFVGPTGVGKTELARATATYMFGSEAKLLRLDMSEFMEKHTVSRLTGAPPGYVGHEDEGQLTGALRRNAHCIVLLDEIEKAHADVLNLFLQVLDAVRLTDSHGRTVDASNVLFILTSNLPVEGDPRHALLQHNMKPELVNRLDRVVVFHRLSQDNIQQICNQLLSHLRQQLQRQQIHLEWDDQVLVLLAQAGFSETFGAREIRRVIDQTVTDTIATSITSGQVRSGKGFRLSTQDGKLKFETFLPSPQS